jgi:hypothetical protein
MHRSTGNIPNALQRSWCSWWCCGLPGGTECEVKNALALLVFVVGMLLLLLLLY